ncbi:MAG: zinc-dependent alcohol dehydrogenase [Christensenellales bacterium]|jgi:threonine dehydrogenase-like Zn-dependent dehydrogenase
MKGKMKAQVFYEAEVMRLEEIDIPQIADDEVLVKVKYCGICGSDISYYYGHSPLGTADGKGPLVLGHEFSGQVVEVGKIPADKGLFKLGDRVICNPVQQCNACDMCADGKFNLCAHGVVPGVSVNGAFAEYCVMKYTHLYHMPEGMTYKQASIVEPLACASYGMKKLDVQLGDFVTVFGPGPIGNMMVAMAKARGAAKVALVGTRDYPLGIGKECGADYIINIRDKNSPNYTDDVVGKISELTGGKMSDRVIVPTSNMEALQRALDVAAGGATIVYFGLPGEGDMIQVPALRSIQSDINIRFAWLAPLVWPTAIKAVAAGIIDTDKIFTHEFSLEDAEKGIIFMKTGQGDKLKGVIVVDSAE